MGSGLETTIGGSTGSGIASTGETMGSPSNGASKAGWTGDVSD